MRLLLVEDDTVMQTTLARALERRGIRICAVDDGEAALTHWQRHTFDAILLDLSLPGLDGLQVLERARAMNLLEPVLILTARGTVGDRVVGLNAGADDYLPKPFDLDELEARIRAMLRRVTPENQLKSSTSAVTCDSDSGMLSLRGQPMELPPREAALLRALLVRPGHAVEKERLCTLVFPGETNVQPEAIEVVAYRLRKKLAGTGLSLMTLRGLGYLLREDEV